METSFNERFTAILKTLDIKPVEAAKRMNVSRQVIDNYMRSTVPRFPHLVEIIKAFPQVDTRWLLLGDDHVNITLEPEDDKKEKRGLGCGIIPH
ncbi:MAG: helix-turn-helix transcriptional regulator [Bacteroidales bacterium]|nr:helix-turn-helix transcriptional regulator [Bacteroidales bacterium]